MWQIPEQKQAEQAAKSVQEGAKKVAEGAESSAKLGAGDAGPAASDAGTAAAQPEQVKPLDFEVLKAVLPDVAGWTRSSVRGRAGVDGRGDVAPRRGITATAAEVELEIVDTAFSQLLLAPISMFLTSGYDERSDEGFKRATKVAGQPAFEEWNQRSARGEVTAVVAGRFILHARGHDVKSIDPVRAVVEAVDLKALR